MRFWMSWWGGDATDMRPLKTDGAPAWALSGERDRRLGPPWSICAVVDAPTEAEAWAIVGTYWPEAEVRFAHRKPDDWTPGGDRFQVITDQLKETT